MPVATLVVVDSPRMIDALLAAGWKEVAPGRGGVLRQSEYWIDDEGLVIEEREGEWWLWIQNPYERRVLSWETNDPQAAAATLARIQGDLTVDSYLEHLDDLKAHGEVAIVMHEQCVQLFDNELTAPGDAMYFFFRDVLQHARTPARRCVYEAVLPDSEPPSARTALRLAFSGEDQPPVVKYTIEAPPFPDQRAPKAKLDHVLWTHDGEVWSPALPEPSPATVDALASIARTGFSVEGWTARAPKLAAGELLSAIVHASVPPPLFDVFDWVQRMQIAACLALAHVDEGWDGSQRKRLLFNVALGPVDWAVVAALIALAHVASLESEARADIESLFEYLVHQAGRPGFTCYAAPLATLWIRLGTLSEARREELAAWGREAWKGGPSTAHSDDEKADVLRRREAVMALDLASPEAARAMRGVR